MEICEHKIVFKVNSAHETVVANCAKCEATGNTICTETLGVERAKKRAAASLKYWSTRKERFQAFKRFQEDFKDYWDNSLHGKLDDRPLEYCFEWFADRIERIEKHISDMVVVDPRCGHKPCFGDDYCTVCFYKPPTKDGE